MRTRDLERDRDALAAAALDEGAQQKRERSGEIARLLAHQGDVNRPDVIAVGSVGVMLAGAEQRGDCPLNAYAAYADACDFVWIE